MKAIVGDKIRVKTDLRRGFVERIKGKALFVRLEDGETAKLSDADLTNFSLAARKAWESMPHRRVGRPRGTSRTDRVSVTLRINRDLWKQFKLAEEEGLILDRTATVNEWIEEKLNELDR
ncbi:MAG: hypothetical protein KDA57_17605 [Planctomycetales bacterium]|nr:hypothetical protein [Planctomycetales bacterium]